MNNFNKSVSFVIPALNESDKNGLGADSHRQPGSAEVLLGSSLLDQHPTAVIDSR